MPYSDVQHVVVGFCFVCLRICVYHILPVSLDCPFLISTSVFSYVYLGILLLLFYILDWYKWTGTRKH